MTPEAQRAARERAKRALEMGRMSPTSGTGGLARNGSFERSDACFDWSRGSCARADCRFSHEGEAGGNPAAGGVMGRGVGSPHRAAAGVCFDHAKGTCKRGDQCRFSHDVAAVAAFAKIASASGSPTGSPTNGRVGGVSIPKPLPIAGGLNAVARPVTMAKEPTPAPIAQRSGAIDYASAAKAGVTVATEGSFAAALVGRKASLDPPLPTAPMPAVAALEKSPTLTTSGASVPTPRFPTPNGASAAPVAGANGAKPAVMGGPTFQFGTGSMLASDQAADDSSNAISFGNASSPKTYPKYPKPEFAFGAGAEAPSRMPNVGGGFVPPVPAGPPPEANQRAQPVAPGFGFSQPGGFGVATPEKSAPHANAWDRNARPNGGVAAADGSSQLGAAWGVSGMGMEGLAEDVYSNVGAYDALGGRSPFGVGLGYSLFSPAAAPQPESVGQQAQGQPQSMWGGATGFGGSFGF